MAVSTSNAFSGPYTANGTTTTFPFTFAAMAATDVAVLLRNADGVDAVVDPASYTVSLTGSVPSAGSVVFGTAPAGGNQVFVYLEPAFDQPASFSDGSAWKAAAVNNVNDRAALRDQALRRDLERSLRVPLGEEGLPIASLSSADGKVLGVVGGVITPIANDVVAAADYADAAAQSAEDANTAKELASAERAAAEVAQTGAQAAQAAAEQAEAAASAAVVASQDYFPGARSYVPQGAATGAATISTAGSGGTNGTFDLAFSGGNFAVNPTGTFTVSGGAVTAITITGPGLYIGNAISKPTLSFAASAGLTGAAGTFNTVYLKTAGQYWLTDTSPASAYLALFQNQANAAVEIDAQFDPMSAGAAADAVASVANVASDATVAATAVYREQLFNDEASTDGQFVAADGTLSANTNYFASEWIKWPAGVTQVCISWANFIVQATESGGVYTVVGGTYVNPNSAAYVLNKNGSATHFRISGQKGNIAAAVQMVVRGSTLPADYIPYDQVIDGSKVRPKTLTGTALASGTVTPDKVSFLSASKNLFNVATILPNYFMGATGALTANSTYSVSDYIPVTPGQTYVSSQNGVLSNLRFWCFFANTSGTVVAGGSNSDGSSFTVPAGANYVRVTHYNSRLTGAQIELGSTPTSWVKYGYTLNPDGYSSSSGTVSGWSGKKWGRLGDSITAARPWASTTAQVLGLTAYDYGSGGTQVGGPSGSTTAMFSDNRINAMDSSLDLITFMGGTNDWFNNRALGAATSTNSEEFNGALNLMAEKLINRYPDDLVVFFTPIWTHALTWASKSWSNAYTNTLGLTPRDYADAIAACGKRYNIPVVDLMARLSWNRLNITTYVADDGELLHPNTAGNNRMAQIYVGGLSELAPVA